VTTIIDYGVGNIGSIANMLKKVNEESVVTSDSKQINDAERLILCGIGAFDDGMSKLESMGIIDVLKHKVMEEKTPVLGVCLGMQLFTEGSEEGNKKGLGFINAFTKKFQFSPATNGSRPHRIPHMGWNLVKASKQSKLFEGMYEDPRFYFVHSYHVVLEKPSDELLTASYGYPFTAAFESGNIIGVQFHPEKSHKYGMKLYENFVKYY
jgi:imidazole glycerol-phosphate synthase subunit HisH